jgi:hypothetical protein
MPIVSKSGSLNLLEPSEPVKACNGIALLTSTEKVRRRRCLKLLLYISKNIYVIFRLRWIKNEFNWIEFKQTPKYAKFDLPKSRGTQPSRTPWSGCTPVTVWNSWRNINVIMTYVEKLWYIKSANLAINDVKCVTFWVTYDVPKHTGGFSTYSAHCDVCDVKWHMCSLKGGKWEMPCTRIEMKQVPAAPYCIIDRAWLLGPAAHGLYSFVNTHTHTHTHKLHLN